MDPQGMESRRDFSVAQITPPPQILEVFQLSLRDDGAQIPSIIPPTWNEETKGQPARVLDPRLMVKNIGSRDT